MIIERHPWVATSVLRMHGCAEVSSLLIESQGKDMYLVLESDTLSLVDPMDRKRAHAQPVVSIRVWGRGP